MGKKEVYRPSEIAKMLGVSTKTISNWINGGKLPAMRTPGGHLLVRAEDVRKFVEEMKRNVVRGS